MVDGSHVAQRCLRCGAIVDDAGAEAAGDAAPDVDLVRRIEPQPSQLPPAPVERPEAAEPEPAAPDGPGDHAALVSENGGEADEESTSAALSALRELGELHAAGVLTDGEFASKKAELLRRV
jgi:hypothetical protein